jgi:H+-translocating NAD(P) transhydrogenase subunit beta
MSINYLFSVGYIISAVLFIVGIKLLKNPPTARKGNFLSMAGMVIAVLSTLFLEHFINFYWILGCCTLGLLIGLVVAYKIKMTDVPQLIAFFNGLGGLASMLIAISAYLMLQDKGGTITLLLFISLTTIIGALTFSGSMVAFLKLAALIPQVSINFGAAHKLVNIILLLYVIIATLILSWSGLSPTMTFVILSIVLISLLIGTLLVLPIGGADMPVVISLFNSYSGIAVCLAGFVLLNIILIVSGALVGASGLILTRLMCKAMNRSLKNVLFGGFSVTRGTKSQASDSALTTHPINIEDSFTLLEAAQNVVIVPGYGMAVAQAQHLVKGLADAMQQNGATVKFAIHPVAGRMPGHMNVLLAEANVPYEQLLGLEEINPLMPAVDLCVIIGANDVTNPAAKDEPSGPLYGMPIIEAYRARTVLILKRSDAFGYAGVRNDLFYQENTRMLYGDAKASLTAVLAAFKS